MFDTAKLAYAIIVMLSILAGYFYWEHGVATEATEACNAKWKERDDDTFRQSIRIKEETANEIKQVKEQMANEYENAMLVYSTYADSLRESKTAGASSNPVRMPAKANCPKSTDRPSQETISELKEFNLSVKACELIIEDFVVKYMEIK